MRKIWMSLMALVAVLVVLPQAVWAAPPVDADLASEFAQGSEGIQFGSYVLGEGVHAEGDLVVFGGPVVIESQAVFDGDLTVFGPMTLERDALVDGELVVMGTADIGGRVDGNVFTAGEITLRDTAYIDGDLSATGKINQSPEAVVTGDIESVDESEWDGPIDIPLPFPEPEIVQIERPDGPSRLVKAILGVLRGIVSVVLMGLLALLVASLWPIQMERAGRAIEEAPLPAYGMGLLALLIAVIVVVLLTVTICLSPFALVGIIIAALGLLLGWVALGAVLGRRLLLGMKSSISEPSLVVSTVVGTVLLTLIVVLSRILGPVHGLLLFLLAPLAVGAVVLTRFGTRPYATRGVVQPLAPRSPVVPLPKAPPSETSPSEAPPSETSPSEAPPSEVPPSEVPPSEGVERELPARIDQPEVGDEGGSDVQSP